MISFWQWYIMNIKTVFPRYWDSWVKDKMVLWPSYLWHRDPYTGKMTSLYLDGPQISYISINVWSVLYSVLSLLWYRLILTMFFRAISQSQSGGHSHQTILQIFFFMNYSPQLLLHNQDELWVQMDWSQHTCGCCTHYKEIINNH